MEAITFELLWDILWDSLQDTAKLIPFLFVTYLAMEALEHSTSTKVRDAIVRADKTGPLVGAFLGALPQCGFSAMAATLYSARVVTLGTLIAVILSTSDEMIPVFIANQAPMSQLAAVVGIKVVIGLIVGFAVDAVLRSQHKEPVGEFHIHELCEEAHCGCAHEYGGTQAHNEHQKSCKHTYEHTHEDAHGDVHEDAHEHTHHEHTHHTTAHDHTHAHTHGANSKLGVVGSLAKSALIHTVEVGFFILLVTFVFGLIIEVVGQEELALFMGSHPVRATFLAGLVGLIPNCGASVALAQLYLDGTLAAGPMLAGLLVNGGMGLLILYRTNKNPRQNLMITSFLYAVGVICGLLVQSLGIIA